MKTVEDFVKFIDIDKQDEGRYAHYPFQLAVVTKDNELIIGALDLGGQVEACYDVFKKFLFQKPKNIYLSVDFPAVGDIEDDFVAVFYLEDGEVKNLAIPYKIKTGKRREWVKKSKTLDRLLFQLEAVCRGKKLIKNVTNQN